MLPAGFESEDFCYITTRGRRTGRPHRIEIWFAAHGSTLYILAGGGERADWVRNIMAEPAIELRVGKASMSARGRVVTDPAEAARARRLVPEKYRTHESGLEEWARTALPVAVEPVE